MCSLGSPIKVFCSDPSIIYDSSLRPEVDVNGHQWPEYTYVKGRSTSIMDMNNIVAVPLKEPLLEMPSNLALSHNVY
jgi:hypothetical protein